MTSLSPAALSLLQGLAVVLVLGLVLALAIGVLLLARPGAAFAINQRLSRWIDTRPAFSALDRPRSLERFFYRHHRLLGALIVLGASYVLWRWAFVYERADLIAVIGRQWVTAGLDWLPAALEVALVGLHVVVLVVGALVFLRPSLLKGVERTANRWQDASANRLDAVIGNLDGAFEGHPRVSGLILTISATWCLLALAPVLSELLRR